MPRFTKILVTGAAGFAGGHLIRELLANGHEVVATDALEPERLGGRLAETASPHLSPHQRFGGTVSPYRLTYRQCDLRDREALKKIFRETAPDACVHLGAVSFVPDGDTHPENLLAINIAGTVNVAEAIRSECQAKDGCPPFRLLFVSSAQVYGPVTNTRTANVPIRENAPPMPLSMYSVSKVAAENAALAFGVAYGFETLVARPANHTGPGQSPKFVAVSFALQMIAAKRGDISEIRVGNLESIRDFTDVRDVARAYRLIIERGHNGLAYNITTNARVKIGELLDILREITGASPVIKTDSALWRPSDASLRLDVSRLREHTGWTPQHALEQTLADIVLELNRETR